MLHIIGAVIISALLLGAIIWSTCREDITKITSAIYRVRFWLLGLLLFWFIVYLMDTNLLKEDLDAINLWLQVFSGNWSPGDAKTIYALTGTDTNSALRPFWFSVSAVAAIIVNLGVLVGILNVLWRQVTSERRLVVKIANLLLTRDLSIKNQLYNAFPNMDKQQIMEIVNTAFREGEDNWKDSLEDIYPDVSNQIKEHLDRKRISEPGYIPEKIFS